MENQKKIKKQIKIIKKIEKHYRWFRRYWFAQYIKRVDNIEKQLGGEIEPC